MQKVCAGLGIKQKFHAANHPQSAGLVECYNGTLKLKIAKVQASTGLNWPDALPLALLSTRTAVHSRLGLSPYEVIFGRPANVWGVPRPKKYSDLPYPMLIDYLHDLTTKLRVLHQQVQSALPEASTDPGHSIRPGDWVCTKNFQRQRNLEPRWREPRLVLLTTRTAVKVEGKKNWVHAVHCKKVPLPLPFDQWVRRGISDSESEKVPQFVPFSDARLIGTLSEKEDDDILQEAIPSHRRLNTTNPGTLFQNQTASGQERYNLRPRPKNL
ncbi:hypothetical protein NDU88_002599 [Pleurodeles waltl]|uniref:Integrase catalytic domain-containing protein n=1 Tax=Pleurodeles waltl TaxID=8319 RepID=A0AAV7NEF6_PLEWA|nr:hypothetical protein NDU88_002599 [Pleurodeles waltl]